MSRKDLVFRKESTRYPGLFVKKYSRHVFYNNLWDENLMECRGHVETADGKTVVRPFTKIFNRFENKTDINRDTPVVAIRKINGFMAAATWVPEYGVVISTTGSLDSDFVQYAESLLPKSVYNVVERFGTFGQARPTTFMFEIVHKDDPHVVPEAEGAYLIGMREVDDESSYMSSTALEKRLDLIAASMGVMRPEWGEYLFSDVVSMAKECQHEGYVVYSKNKALKIKSPYYLVTKFLGRLSKNKMETLATDPLSLKKDLDEEFYPVLETIARTKDFVTMDEQTRMAFIRGCLKGLQQ